MGKGGGILAVYLVVILVSRLVLMVEGRNEIKDSAGLSPSFYKESCPAVYPIAASFVKASMAEDFTDVAGVLRLFFHDCFVQGCDASILLDGTPANPSEKQATPNLTLRPRAFKLIDDIKNSVEAVCPGIVSCSDIISLATRFSIREAFGPDIPLPTGRRDSLSYASSSETLANIPSPAFPVSQLIQMFNSHGLNVEDMVVLSGAHTVGRAHCNTFSSRLRPVIDEHLDRSYAQRLINICPTDDSTNAANLDEETPLAFDSKYFDLVAMGKGLLASDDALYFDDRTSGLVHRYRSQTDFYDQFSASLIKMSQIGVLTGNEGQIRHQCSLPNPLIPVDVI